MLSGEILKTGSLIAEHGKGFYFFLGINIHNMLLKQAREEIPSRTFAAKAVRRKIFNKVSVTQPMTCRQREKFTCGKQK